VADLIAKFRPDAAKVLHWFYNHRLLPGLRRARAVRQEEESNLTLRQAWAQKHNATIDQQQEALAQQREATTQELVCALKDIEEPLAAAHREAAWKVSRTGAPYSSPPNASCVLRFTPEDMQPLVRHRLGEQLHELQSARDLACAPERDHLAALGHRVAAAHLEACTKVARVAGRYDSAATDLLVVPQEQPLPEEVAAARLKLPWTPGDQDVIPSWIWIITALIGAATGASIGIAGGFYEADALLRHTGKVLSFMALGWGISTAMMYSLIMVFKAVGERYWLGRPAGSWAPLLAFGSALGVFYVVLHSKADQMGLMALARLHEKLLFSGAPSSNGKQMDYFLLGCTVTAGHIVLSSLRGYHIGRYHACRNRVLDYCRTEWDERLKLWRERKDVQQAIEAVANAQELTRQQEQCQARLQVIEAAHTAKIEVLEAEQANPSPNLLASTLAEYDEAWRARPVVQEALEAVSHAQLLCDRKAELEAQIRQQCAPFDAKIAAIESQRVTAPVALSDAAEHRVDDALDNADGAQEVFDGMLVQAIQEARACASQMSEENTPGVSTPCPAHQLEAGSSPLVLSRIFPLSASADLFRGFREPTRVSESASAISSPADTENRGTHPFRRRFALGAGLLALTLGAGSWFGWQTGYLRPSRSLARPVAPRILAVQRGSAKVQDAKASNAKAAHVKAASAKRVNSRVSATKTNEGTAN
jgi:hypothetical protein